MGSEPAGSLISLNPRIPDCQVEQFSPDLQDGGELPFGTTVKVLISAEELNRRLA